MARKRKENGIDKAMDFFEEKLSESFGVPQIKVPALVMDNEKDKEAVGSFIKGNSNIIVLGKGFYPRCVKLVRLRFIGDLSLSMKWMPQSILSFNTSIDSYDLIALVNLFKEEVPAKKSLLGQIVNQALSSNTQVLLGVPDVDTLEEAFPYDLDTVENNFEVWKLG